MTDAPRFLSHISQTRTIEGSLVMKSYLEYEITCEIQLSGLGATTRTARWSVWKRYSDFERFNILMCSLITGWSNINFPLPHRMMLRQTAEFLTDRLKDLKEYWEIVVDGLETNFASLNESLYSVELRDFLDATPAKFSEISRLYTTNEKVSNIREKPTCNKNHTLVNTPKSALNFLWYCDGSLEDKDPFTGAPGGCALGDNSASNNAKNDNLNEHVWYCKPCDYFYCNPCYMRKAVNLSTMKSMSAPSQKTKPKHLVCCPASHKLYLSSRKTQSWICNASQEVASGCLCGDTRFLDNAYTTKQLQYRCQECDFDYCGPCYNSKLTQAKLLIVSPSMVSLSSSSSSSKSASSSYSYGGGGGGGSSSTASPNKTTGAHNMVTYSPNDKIFICSGCNKRSNQLMTFGDVVEDEVLSQCSVCKLCSKCTKLGSICRPIFSSQTSKIEFPNNNSSSGVNYSVASTTSTTSTAPTAFNSNSNSNSNTSITNAFTKVACINGHYLRPSSSKIPYVCDAIKFGDGHCKSGGDGTSKYTAGKPRYRCDTCDFDYCGPCYFALLNFKLSYESNAKPFSHVAPPPPPPVASTTKVGGGGGGVGSGLSSGCVNSLDALSPNTHRGAASPFSTGFSAASPSPIGLLWNCSSCTFENKDSATKCAVCDTKKNIKPSASLISKKDMFNCLICKSDYQILQNNIPMSVSCSHERKQHTICRFCFTESVKFQISERGEFTNFGKKIICRECFSSIPKDITTYDHVAIAKNCDDRVFSQYLEAREDAVMLEEKCKLEGVLQRKDDTIEDLNLKLTMLSEPDTSKRQNMSIERHVKRIIRDILEIRCPNCDLVFGDFDGCFAVKHEGSYRDKNGKDITVGCRNFFCAWCLTKFKESKPCHEHVKLCAANPHKGSYSGKIHEYHSVHAKERRAKIFEYFDENLPLNIGSCTYPSSAAERQGLKLALQPHLKNVGISLD